MSSGDKAFSDSLNRIDRSELPSFPSPTSVQPNLHLTSTNQHSSELEMSDRDFNYEEDDFMNRPTLPDSVADFIRTTADYLNEAIRNAAKGLRMQARRLTPAGQELFADSLRYRKDDLVETLTIQFERAAFNQQRLEWEEDYADSPHPLLRPTSPELSNSPLPTDDAINALAEPNQQLEVDVDFGIVAEDSVLDGSAASSPSAQEPPLGSQNGRMNENIDENGQQYHPRFQDETPRRAAGIERKSLLPRLQSRPTSRISGAASQLAPQQDQGRLSKPASPSSGQNLVQSSTSPADRVVAPSPQGNAHRSQSAQVSSANKSLARNISSIPRPQAQKKASALALQQSAAPVQTVSASSNRNIQKLKQNGTSRQRCSMRIMKKEQRDAHMDREKFPFESEFDENSDDEEPELADVDLVVIGERKRNETSRRVMFQENYVCRTAKLCFEARRGQKDGSLRLDYKNFPGIPDRKFMELEEASEQDQWPVQAIYEVKGVPNTFNVHYEGWGFQSSEKLSKNNLQHLSAVFQSFEIRTNFLKAFKTLNPGLQDVVNDHLYLCDDFINDQKHLFWVFEDIGYFHSQINYEKNGAPVFYFCFLKEKEPVLPPKYGFVQTNVVKSQALSHCKRRHANKKFSELNKDFVPVKNQESPCNGLCLCDERFKSLYQDPSVKNLIPSREGKLDLSGVGFDDRRILIECTDACGCGLDCPRRQLQNCRQKALVVNYEGGERGYGVCAGEDIEEGELITEYTGLMSMTNTNENFDASYVAGFSIQSDKLMIDALHLGNVSRFFNNHCDANTMFVETESRRSEDDVLIPKISVYARRNIKCGEPVTLRYYGEEPYKKYTDIKCGCGAGNCVGCLPQS